MTNFTICDVCDVMFLGSAKDIKRHMQSDDHLKTVEIENAFIPSECDLRKCPKDVLTSIIVPFYNEMKIGIILSKYIQKYNIRGDIQDGSVLLNAARLGHLQIVKHIISRGFRTGIDYAMVWAALCRHLEVVKYLVSKGADIHYKHDKALGYAAIGGDIPTLQYLLSMGSDISVVNDWARQNEDVGYSTPMTRYLLGEPEPVSELVSGLASFGLGAGIGLIYTYITW